MQNYFIDIYLDLPNEIKKNIKSFLPSFKDELIKKTTKDKYWFNRITINDRFYFYESQLSLGGDIRIYKDNEKMLKKLFEIETDLTKKLTKKSILKMHKKNLNMCHLRNMYTVVEKNLFQDAIPYYF